MLPTEEQGERERYLYPGGVAVKDRGRSTHRHQSVALEAPPAMPLDAQSLWIALGEFEIRCLEEADSQHAIASRWRKVHYAIGSPAAGLATLGGGGALASSGFHILFASLAITGGFLAAVATALRAGERADHAEVRAAAMDQLAHEARVLQRLDLVRVPYWVGREEFDRLRTAYAKAVGAMPLPTPSSEADNLKIGRTRD